MKIARKSLLSGEINILDLPVTQQQLDRFENRRATGEYVQTIFKELSPADREFILNGITAAEWAKTYGE